MTKDNYPVAAVRHFVDGTLLLNNKRTDNAMCHFAFSAECAMKTLYERLSDSPARGLSHGTEKEWDNIMQYLDAIQILDAKVGNLMANTKVPEALFCRHPGRRYEGDIFYSQGELEASRKFTEELIRKIVMDVIDGRIQVEE